MDAPGLRAVERELHVDGLSFELGLQDLGQLVIVKTEHRHDNGLLG